MATVVHRLDVDAAPETVFDHVVDLRTEPVWNPAARRVELLTDDPVGLGSRFRGAWRGFGTAAAEVVAFDRPRHWRTRVRFRGLDVDIVGDVAPRDGHSHLTLTLEFAPRGPLRPLLPVLAAGLRIAGRVAVRRLGWILTMPGV